jgi:hypothetical protein
MFSRLHDALRLTGVPEDKARAAAEEVALHGQVRRDLIVLRWMVGALIMIALAVLYMQWQTLALMDDVAEGFARFGEFPNNPSQP